jgi:hypothetical protein
MFNNLTSVKTPLLILTIVFLFNGCNETHSINGDYVKELSGEYFYRSEGAEMNDIISHLPNRKEIYSNVLDYNYDSDFIIATQQPIHEQYKSMIAFYLRDDTIKYPVRENENIVKSEQDADSILKNDEYYKSIFKNKINYWIISLKVNKLYGPLTKAEYLQKRKELKVPNELEFKQIH